MNFCTQWRSWIRQVVIFIYILIVLVALPYLIIEFQEKEITAKAQFEFIGGLFVILAVPISFWGILQHFIHYTQPLLQRHIIRIIWMVPIYGINAWLALLLPRTTLYLDTARECYEAYVIYNFMAYLLRFLWTEYPELDEHLEEKPQTSHIFPFCCLPKWRNGQTMLSYCKHGVLQYTVIRPLMAIVAFIAQLENQYNEGEFTWSSLWIYVTFVKNCSQIWAMYCLVLFYKATKEELKPIKPVPKFICIKAVVFFSFWQSVLLSMLVYFKVISVKDESIRYDSMLQDLLICVEMFFAASAHYFDDTCLFLNLLICIEMFFAAIAHYYSFSHKPFVDYAQGHQNWVSSFKSMFDISDVSADVVDHVRVVGTSTVQAVTRPLRKPPPGTETEKSPLLLHRQDSTTSSDAHGATSGTEDSEYGCLAATPPVVLTVRDFQLSTSVESAHSDEQCDVMDDSVLDPAVHEEMPVSVEGGVGGEEDSQDLLLQHSPPRELIDFVTHAPPPSGIRSVHCRPATTPVSDTTTEATTGSVDCINNKSRHSSGLSGEQLDSLSVYTVDSLASEPGAGGSETEGPERHRRSLTSSMNNYARFSETSVESNDTGSSPFARSSPT